MEVIKPKDLSGSNLGPAGSNLGPAGILEEELVTPRTLAQFWKLRVFLGLETIRSTMTRAIENPFGVGRSCVRF